MLCVLLSQLRLTVKFFSGSWYSCGWKVFAGPRLVKASIADLIAQGLADREARPPSPGASSHEGEA